ncbi:MAG: spermidine/putrescine transport system substrate-binding protein [Solirubrobacteraceae bacterium]|nr:spermidine/putrescine transport system substrate-binding protein [Solirubrobacteraceae bacterium]
MTKRPRTAFERRLDELMQDELTRRTLVRRGAAGALSVTAMAYLAACGDSGGGLGPRKASSEVIKKGPISKELVFANWPYYIDVEGKKHPSLDRFEKKYGTHVKYIEEINDNNEFFGKVNQQYARGNSGGRDLQVLTDWMCERMKRLGYVQKLDKSAMPNVVNNITDAVAHPDFDPNREYSVPWQSGQVILIWRKDKTGGPLSSINDLFDPKFKGKVTMLTEMRDTVGSILLADGVKPEDATLDQVMTAIEKIGKASKDGQIRRFTGNEYIKELPAGDSHAVLGWSGDAVSLVKDEKNIAYAQPKEGFMIFTDTMQIPVGAPHAYTAEKFMDFVYDPEIAAQIETGIGYVPPVKGAREALKKLDPALGNSDLVFPDLTNSHNFKTFSPKEQTEIDSAFQKAIGA